MLDYGKIQMEVLKAAEKSQDKFSYDIWDGYVIVMEGTYAIAVPENEFYLDRDKVFGGRRIDEVIDWDDIGKELTDTRYSLSKGGMMLRIFETEEKEKIYINSIILNKFGYSPEADMELELSEDGKFIRVYSCIKSLLGVIFPVAVKEE